jgi:hypothetical protein
MLCEDALPPQFVDRADHRVDLKIAGLCEQIKGEVAADSGGQRGDIACMRGCRFKPTTQESTRGHRAMKDDRTWSRSLALRRASTTYSR